mmetsp:Transcript_37099/g.75677  ORF Transcript_37099/g.75677 Transcript_37099/m.75677 type:complete len:252 (+) Transcript_37099:1506-2261(+)
MMAVHLVVSFSVQTIVLFSLKFKVAVSSESLQPPRSRMLSGLLTVARLPCCASMVSSLLIVSSNNFAPSVTLYVSRAVPGTSAQLAAQTPTSLFTLLFTMLNTASQLAIPVPFALWTTQFTQPGLSRIVYSVLTGKPDQESSVSTRPKHASSLLSPTKSTDKLCTWSNTAASVVEQSLLIFNLRASLKWLFTSYAILKHDSALLLLAVISRPLWRAPFRWSSSKVLTASLVMSGVNLAARLFAKEITKLLK